MKIFVVISYQTLKSCIEPSLIYIDLTVTWRSELLTPSQRFTGLYSNMETGYMYAAFLWCILWLRTSFQLFSSKAFRWGLGVFEYQVKLD